MPERSRREPESTDTLTRHAELLDVQVLDLLAHIEALLRQGRDVQRESLRVRGVRLGAPVTATAAAMRITETVAAMQRDHQSLGTVLRALRKCADDLKRLAAKR
jgi:hypothetical protein